MGSEQRDPRHPRPGYEDRCQAASNAGQEKLTRGPLDKAIEAYLKGFESVWRDACPGINAVTLMELRDPPDLRQQEILPVVTYSVKRRIESGEADYWDHATLLELAVLSKDPDAASAALVDVLVPAREVWEPEATLRNLQLIRKSRETRGEDVGWLIEIEGLRRPHARGRLPETVGPPQAEAVGAEITRVCRPLLQ